MSFTVNDLHDMIEIMESNPAWKKDLRRVLMGDDFLEIPDLVKELVAINRRHDERFGRVELRLDTLEQDVSVLKQDVSVLKQDVSVLKQDVAGLKGADRERRIRERPHIYLGKFVRGARTVSDEALLTLLEEAVQVKHISQAQADDAERIDALVMGKLPGGEKIYLVIEATGTANAHDIIRAIRRAQIVQAATQQRAIPIVAGKRVLPALQTELESAGGGWVEIDPATVDVV